MHTSPKGAAKFAILCLCGTVSISVFLYDCIR